MGSAAHQQYLSAIGIDCFVRRDQPVQDMGPEPAAESFDTSPARAYPDESAVDWEQLRQQVSSCQACALHRGRTQAVFGVGDPRAGWMIVGEGPGAEEDRRGEPFVGRSGKLLDEMLRAVGLDRNRVFIANIVKCRPPGNRDPEADEMEACRDFLDRQIRFVQPKLILAVGRIAAQSLLATDAPVGRLRGRTHTLKTSNTPVVVTYHPAYLLRSPRQKSKSWDDLQLAQRTYELAA